MSFLEQSNPSTTPSSPDMLPHGDGLQYESLIRNNVQIIRNNLQRTEEHVIQLRRHFVSKRIIETLHDKLKDTYQVVLETEQLLKQWNNLLQQSENTVDRQRKRFLYEKLHAHFQMEVRRVQEVSESVREAAVCASEADSQLSPSSLNHPNQTSHSSLNSNLSNHYHSSDSDNACNISNNKKITNDSNCINENKKNNNFVNENFDNTNVSYNCINMNNSVNCDVNKNNNQITNNSLRVASTSTSNNNERHNANSREMISKKSPNRKSTGVLLDIQNSAFDDDSGNDNENFFMMDQEQQDRDLEEMNEQECLIQRTVNEDRYQGIQRIQGQVIQANQIFRDLAQLVFQQDENIDSIEAQLQEANHHSKAGVSELYRAHLIQKRSRQRRCMLIFFGVVALVTLLYMSNFFAFLHSPLVAQSIPESPNSSSSHPSILFPSKFSVKSNAAPVDGVPSSTSSLSSSPELLKGNSRETDASLLTSSDISEVSQSSSSASSNFGKLASVFHPQIPIH